MIRAVTYFRKSNDDDREQGASIGQQRDWAGEACRKEGVAAVREFADQSISGLETRNRPGLQDLMAFCEAECWAGNPVRAVVCWNIDRFSRADSLEASALLYRLREAGTSQMLTREGWIDLTTDTGRILFTMKQEFGAHRYSKELSAASRRGRKALAVKGHYVTGRPPFGYVVEGLRLAPHPTEAEIVRDLFHTYATTDISIMGLAARLRDRGICTPRGKRLWQPSTLNRLLANEVYLGTVVFARKDYSRFTAVTVPAGKPVPSRTPRGKTPTDMVRVPDAHPPLIDRETFDRVHARLIANRGRKSPRKTAPFPLSGLLVCGDCGRRMVAYTMRIDRGEGKHHDYRVYTCSGYVHHGRAGCTRNTVEDGRMTRAVVKKLMAGFTSPGAVEALKAEIKRQDAEAAGTTTDQRPGLQARAADLTAKMGRLIDRLTDDIPADVVTQLKAKLADLSEQREAANRALAALEATATPAATSDERIDRLVSRLGSLQEAVRTADQAAVSELFRGLVDRIEVHFTKTREGKRTRATFAHAFVALNDGAWSLSAVPAVPATDPSPPSSSHLLRTAPCWR